MKLPLILSFIAILTSCKKDPNNELPNIEIVTVSKTQIQLNSNINQKDSFEISYSLNWKITIDQPNTWLRVDTTIGSGDQKVIVTAIERNTSGKSRVAVFTISATNNASEAKTVTVTQTAFTTTSWQQKYGSPWVVFYDVAQDADSSFIAVGHSRSDPNNLYLYDLFVVKTYPDGQKAWEKTIGGIYNEMGNSVTVTAEGYLIAGTAFTEDDGDYSTDHTGEDGWLLQLDFDGNVLWEKKYGFIQQDVFHKIIPDRNGGFLLTGRKNFTGWLLKVDAAGEVVWDKAVPSLGGVFTSGYQTSDGGFVVAGDSDSPPSGDMGIHKGEWDCRIMKIDASGNILWDKLFGGDADDKVYDIIEATDGGSIVVGFTRSSMTGDVEVNNGWDDNWVLKINPMGALVWQKTYGSSESDGAVSVLPLNSGGGYLIASNTYGNDKDILQTQGKHDAWMYSIDELGNVGWQRSVGGSEFDIVQSIIYAGDGYYLGVGASWSSDGDLLNSGDGTAWQFLIKTGN